MEILSNALSNLGYTAYSIISAIVVIFAVSFFTMLSVRGRYRKLQKDLKAALARKESKFRSQVLDAIVEEYRTISMTARGEINTQAIVEKNFSTRLKGLGLGERFVKNSVSLMVVLGLLGTFYGLTLSVGKLVELLNTGGNSNMLIGMDSVISGLISSVRGMSVAFSTSLAGVGGSIIITVLGILVNVEEARQSLMIQLEDYLDNVVEQELLGSKESELSRVGTAITTSFDGVSHKVEEVLKSTVSDFSDKLSTASGSIEKASNCLEETIRKFEDALALFSNNTRDFSEFNYNLKGNIERMDVGFLNLRESLVDTAKIINSNQKVMSDFTDAVQQAAVTISSEKGPEPGGNR
ncbi:MAG TPA: hypothetical protein VEG39_14410 [Clostridia bacterium]|nr:hypothetical protein [Clostridia bacterium]